MIGSSSDVSGLGLDGSSVDKSRNSFRFVCIIISDKEGGYVCPSVCLFVHLCVQYNSKTLFINLDKMLDYGPGTNVLNFEHLCQSPGLIWTLLCKFVLFDAQLLNLTQ